MSESALNMALLAYPYGSLKITEFRHFSDSTRLPQLLDDVCR
jgi:hypothetical protein